MNWRSRKMQQLTQAVLALRDESEVRRFLRDLLTEEELQEFGRRLEAAQLLREGVPYVKIQRRTGLSSTTVARVAKWLHGSEGGYRTVLERLN
ncbi:MAG: YerC/YecD family TrpR-related protein [bacterium]